MDQQALFKLTYGLFVLGTVEGDKRNACIINTAQQVTSIPEKISITVSKSNLTHDMIVKSQQFSVSVLSEKVPLDVVNHFGMQSGREVNKFEAFPYKEDKLGNPYIEEGVSAVLTGKVVQQLDLGTHTLFVADLVDSLVLNNEDSITYAGYRNKKQAQMQQEKQKTSDAVYECSICHYEYDGEVAFEDLPEDYVCPVCKQPKSVFIKR